MKEFNYIWCGSPIDFWAGAMIASEEETARVLYHMPEKSRDDIVFKTYIPGDTQLHPLYMCKADNNGSIYYFSDFDFISYYIKNWVIEDRRD